MGSRYTNKKKHKYKKKKIHTRKLKYRGGVYETTNINIGFHAPALGMITKGNSKFKDYDGDKLTSIVNMTHNTSFKNLIDNVDETLASIVYGKTEQNYPQPVYNKHISIQVPPTSTRFPRPDIGTGVPPTPTRFPRPDIGTGVPPTPPTTSTKCASGSTHYETLGVDKYATIEQINRAYRIKSRLCHPDKRPEDIYAVKQQSEINNAKDILIDETKRKQYDKYLRYKKFKTRKQSRKK